jgi:hypothetical protein
VNFEESDALVGIVVLQMPTTRGRIIRLDADAFARQTISRWSVQGGPAATIRSEVRLDLRPR